MAGEAVRAFVPRPLPPDPPLQLDGRLQVLQEQALPALGRLDALSTLPPDTHLFLYLKQRRDEYYRRLDRIRTEGDWEGWVRFFLEGVRETANGAVATAQ